jgi:putative spermidine/putrescine transport system permease protein
VVVFLQIPVLVVVLAAFSKTAYLTIPPKGLTLHWFEVVLRDPEYLAPRGPACGSPRLDRGRAGAGPDRGLCAIHRRMVPGAGALTSLFMAPLILPRWCSAWRCCSTSP